MIRIPRRMLLVVAALTAAACGNAGEPAAQEDAGGDETVAIVAEDFAFEPTSIPAPAGTDLTIEVSNEDDVEHTFTVKAIDVDVVIAPGATEEVDVTVPDDGAAFVCRFHPNMTGTIGDAQTGGGMGTDSRDDLDY